MEQAGITTLPCRQTVEQVLRRTVSEIEQRELTIFCVVDHSGEAAEVGLTMPETKLVIFGSPKGGTPLMVAHPELALDLPLKLLIWERSPGEVCISYNVPAFLAARHGLSADETGALGAVAVIAGVVANMS
jgi:uncharacterized protein (DUF302 family)